MSQDRLEIRVRENLDFIDLMAQQNRIRADLKQRIETVLQHGKYIMGPEVSDLEERLSEYTGAEYVISCANGTDALILALMAIGVKEGDEVITPAFSFYAAAEAIAFLKATPVLVDVDPSTYLIDLNQLEDSISSATKAVIPVSLYGQMADMDALGSIAERHKIVVIEDGAQSFGATQNGKKSCGASLIATTSFFPSKPLGCYGDGGAVFTQDIELAEKIRMLRVHGAKKRYHHELVGMNSRLDTIQAAVLLAKLEVFAVEVELRQKLASYYDLKLSTYVQTPKVAEGNTHVYGQYTIRLQNRDEVARKLAKLGVPTAVHYPIPLHRQSAMQGVCRTHDTRNSDHLSDEVMSLPMHPYLEAEQQDFVIDSVMRSL